MLTLLAQGAPNPLEHVLPHELLLLPHQHGTSPFTNQMIMATVAEPCAVRSKAVRKKAIGRTEIE